MKEPAVSFAGVAVPPPQPPLLLGWNMLHI
jgi:hypothetical protein